MTRSKKGTIGKQIVEPFFCPVCQGRTGERQIGKDIFCPPKTTKVTALCYHCGFSESLFVK